MIYFLTLVAGVAMGSSIGFVAGADFVARELRSRMPVARTVRR